MITLAEADLQVAKKLPPSVGQYAGWDWRSFYNAILHVLQHPASQEAYYAAYRAFNALPAEMKLTPQVLTAGFARFTQLYPGWETWDYRAAYDNMVLFMKNTGRLLEGDDRQWWTVEREWQAMEVPKMAFVSRPSMGLRY